MVLKMCQQIEYPQDLCHMSSTTMSYIQLLVHLHGIDKIRDICRKSALRIFNFDVDALSNRDVFNAP